MFTKEEYEELLNVLLETSADFAEIYVEESLLKQYVLQDSKIDDIKTNSSKGIGIRLIFGKEVFYYNTSNINFNSLLSKCKDIRDRFALSNTKRLVELKEKKVKDICPIKIPFDSFKIEDKIKLLKDLDKTAREYSPYIDKVTANIQEKTKSITIVNSDNLFVRTTDNKLRIMCVSYAKRDSKETRSYDRLGTAKGYEILDEKDILNIATKASTDAVLNLDAITIEGKEMPVIIGNDFGAVIFHEACGHGLEATSVAEDMSVFANKLGEIIASSKVTFIDDATIENSWGSYSISDEGELPKKNILIEKGILKNYLIDKHNSKIMNMASNGCGRRENYTYLPTSRMSNTYLDKGTDKIEDMIKSIDYGIYAKSLNGGTVNPITGDFNFNVSTAYLIEKGTITSVVQGVSLIGNSLDILKEVSMVSDDLYLSDGYCGSSSGLIFVTVGQPTIKVDKILVGGSK